MAALPDCPPPRASAFDGFRERPVRGVPSLGGRPCLRRGLCDRRRARTVPGTVRGVHRTREGSRHGVPDPAEFRDGSSRGLSQGDPADGSRRPLRPAGNNVDRHAGRLSRSRCGRTGAGGSDCAHSCEGIGARGSDHCDNPRGGGVRRRGGARHGQPGTHAGARGLFRHLPGGLRIHSLARHRKGRERRCGAPAYGERHAATRRDRPDREGAARGAHRSPEEALQIVGEAIAEEVDLLDGSEPDEVRRQRREKFLAMGAAPAQG